MRSKIDSKNIQKPKKTSIKKLAYNKRVDPFEEMKVYVSKYRNNNSEFKIRINENKTNVKVRFSNKSVSDQVKIQKNHGNSEVYNPAFGKHQYKDLSLFSICIRSGNGRKFERLIANYWGEVSDNEDCKEFVRKNARIVGKDFVLGPNSRSQSMVSRNNLVATDVNAYTKNRKPNPWCRNCLILLYEDSSVIRNIKNHSSLGISKSDFQPILSSNIIQQKHLN
jgi:hypothetical protein